MYNQNTTGFGYVKTSIVNFVMCVMCVCPCLIAYQCILTFTIFVIITIIISSSSLCLIFYGLYTLEV